MSLVGECTRDETAIEPMNKMENASVVAEGVCLSAYLGTAKSAGKPLVSGKQAKLFWIGTVTLGMIIPALLHRRKSRPARIASSLLTIAGSLALKWAIIHAGPESSLDRQLANQNANRGGWSVEASVSRNAL